MLYQGQYAYMMFWFILGFLADIFKYLYKCFSI
jgi:hypothetical protein